MKQVHEAKNVSGGVEPKHEVEQLCAHCGYDLDEAELAADTCSDCGEVLNLKQNMKLFVTTMALIGEAEL